MATYDTLDEFLADIGNHDHFEPELICEDLDVDVCYTDKLPDPYLGLADPIQRAIFINAHVSKPFSNFLIAHELTHVTLGEVPAAYLESTYVTYLKSENQANRGAIVLLIRYYLESTGISIDRLDVTKFIDAFDIPPTYYFLITDVAASMEFTDF